MPLTDPIANMLTLIRNAVRAKHEKVDIPGSKLLLAIAEILKAEGYVENYRVVKDATPQGILRIYLRYIGKKSAILNLKRVSRPGLRVYTPARKIPRVLRGKGISIITTSQGLMTGENAKVSNLGGEVLCYIW